MGNLNPFCCSYIRENSNNSLKLMQTQVDRKDNKNVYKYVLVFDVEYNTPKITYELKSSPTFYGMGEINYENSLYLVGGNEKENGGTYFLRYDSMTNKLEHLVNTRMPHKDPTLCFAKQYLYCIGGEDKNVERYDFNLNTWEEVPQLKLERSQCSPFYCEFDEHLYLFGGFIDFSKSNLNVAVRIKVGERAGEFFWEECFLNLDYNYSTLLKKSMMGVIPISPSELLLVGGDKNTNQEFTPSNQVVIVNIEKETVLTKESHLKKAATFKNKQSVMLPNSRFAYLIDETYSIHRYNMLESHFSLE